MSWCCSSSKNVEVPGKKPSSSSASSASSPSSSPSSPTSPGVVVGVKVAQKPVMLKFRLPSDEDMPTVVIPAGEAVRVGGEGEGEEREREGTSSYSRMFRGLVMVIGAYALAYFVASSSPSNPNDASPPPIFLNAYA